MMTASELARPLPAMSGALPWTASKTAMSSPMLEPGTRPKPPTNPRKVADQVAIKILVQEHVEFGFCTSFMQPASMIISSYGMLGYSSS